MPVPVSVMQIEMYCPGARSRSAAARASSHLLAVSIVSLPRGGGFCWLSGRDRRCRPSRCQGRDGKSGLVTPMSLSNRRGAVRMKPSSLIAATRLARHDRSRPWSEVRPHQPRACCVERQALSSTDELYVRARIDPAGASTNNRALWADEVSQQWAALDFPISLSLARAPLPCART